MRVLLVVMQLLFIAAVAALGDRTGDFNQCPFL
jgi:hypothetical protein